MGLEKACATILGKLGRPKAMSFMPYRCTLSLLFVIPMALNMSHVAPVQQHSTCHRSLQHTAAAVTEQSTWQHKVMHALHDNAHLSLVQKHHNYSRQMHDKSCQSAVMVMGSQQAEVCSIVMGRQSNWASVFVQLTSYAVGNASASTMADCNSNYDASLST